MMSSTTRSRSRLIIGGGVAVAAVAALGVAGAVALSGDDRAAATTPRTATVSTGDVTLTVSAAGTVNAVGARTLSFGASGTVSSLKVAAGDTVAEGAVLARLDTGDAQDAVQSAQDNVDAAEEALTSAENAAAAAEEAAARAAATPTTPPGTSGSAAGPAAGGSGPTSGSGGSRGSESRQGTSADAVFAAQQRLNNAELALANAQRALAGTTIKAPVTGKIISISGAVGSEVSAGGAFIVLAGRDDLAVTASFSEAAVARLEVGQAATVTLAGRAADPVAGTVSQVDPIGTVSSRLVTYGAQITFTDVPSDLLVGQSADVTVTTATATGVLYVPSAAVTGIDGQSGTVTVASGSGSTTEVRTVGVGLRGDQYTEITSGLTAGETVVLPG
ncbi:efflux RND transporter periplasmic adaptor subunit [Luedemannella helvata]|uniref:Multidrug resistance protein MdtA-like C-terminal permuted SH3 domain-containing protein n=1 Tax=Luedemannella helvata TaxID=349315 RepID=A0ABN2JQX6_9ACTN